MKPTVQTLVHASAAVVLAASVTVAGDGASATAAAAPGRSAGDPLRVLHAWDRARAAAFVAASPARLRALYDARSTAAAADVALLRAYAGRGIRVTTWETQVFAGRVLQRTVDRLRVRVLDRAVVFGEDPRGCRRLRTRPPAQEELVLRRAAHGWVLVSAEPVTEPDRGPRGTVRPGRAGRSR